VKQVSSSFWLSLSASRDKSVVTVSRSRFSAKAPSAEMEISYPFDTSLLLKSTNWTIPHASENAVNGSIAELNTVLCDQKQIFRLEITSKAFAALGNGFSLHIAF